MEFTEIKKRNGETIRLNTISPYCEVKSAVQTSTLMGDDYITLQIVSSEWLSFAKGDKIVVDGFDYTIRTTTKCEIQGENHYIFEPVFYGPMYDLIKTLYRNTDKDGNSDRSTFDLTYTIKEFVQVLIYNLNRDYPGLWAFDENNCPETEAKTIQFSGVNCLQALQSLCSKDNFNLEFLITQDGGVRTIHIGKFGQRVNPPAGNDYFEWGKGNGLYKLTEQKIDDKAIITRLWVEGGTSNIRTNYRNYSERLQLPCPRRYNRKEHTLYDGTVVVPGTELIGIDDDSKRYLEDADLRDKIGSEEDAKTYDEIFPTRTGRVTALVSDDINAFIDDTMDFDLCEKDANGTKYMVDSVNPKITFTSGRLAGQQFELEAKGGYDHATKKFKLIPFTDKRGLTTPTVSVEQGGAFPIEVGDTYKITDIFLPESYEQNAEEELWYAGYNDFKPATQAKAQYSLTLDRLYFLDALSRDSEVCMFRVGDYVPVKDTRYGIEKQIRIQKITRNLLLEQDYQLTLSDTIAISIQTQTVLSVIEHEQIINNNRLRDLSKARRGWRTTEELRNMVYDTDGYFDMGNIRPNSIDTNMLTVGSRSQQFVLTGVILQANAGGNPNVFSASAGILSHLTIDPSKIRAWQMSSIPLPVPTSGGYYLFAKCPKFGERGTWLLTQTQYTVEVADDPNNYYFLVGVLSSLYPNDNFRDFQTTYGFTRINGNTITTGRIITSDKECYLDLDGNKFRIGDKSSSIDWNVSRTNAITLKNVSVISESGDVAPLGVYRGVWNANYIYYSGDEVTYTENGVTCSYRYIHPTPTKGYKPTEDVYWNIVAKGADGSLVPNLLNRTGNGKEGWKTITASRLILDENGNETTESELITCNPWSMTSKDYYSPGYIGVGVTTGGLRLNGFAIAYKVPAGAVASGQKYTLSFRITCYQAANLLLYFSKNGYWSGMTSDFVEIKPSKDEHHVTGKLCVVTLTPNSDDTGWVVFNFGSSMKNEPSGTGIEIGDLKVERGVNPSPLWQPSYADANGKFTEIRYGLSGSKTNPPALSASDREPAGWSTKMPVPSALQYVWSIRAVINGTTNELETNWDTPVRITPYDGVDGSSPALVYRGEYDPAKIYYGTPTRVDAVKYNGIYYVARVDAASFRNVLPTDESKWNTFGLEFDSIATGLLLAENANIAGWIFRDNKLYSQDGGCYLDGETGDIVTTGLVLKKIVHINSTNLSEYMRLDESQRQYYFDFYKAGSVIAVDDPPEIDGKKGRCLLPSIYATGVHTEESKNLARQYIGTTIVIYNNTEKAFAVTGATTDDENSQYFTSPDITPGYWYSFECKIRSNPENGKEEIFWLRKRGII